MILNGSLYPDLINAAYNKLEGDKKWVINRCNQLIENVDDEKKERRAPSYTEETMISS